jgi:hypothetical protein
MGTMVFLSGLQFGDPPGHGTSPPDVVRGSIARTSKRDHSSSCRIRSGPIDSGSGSTGWNRVAS